VVARLHQDHTVIPLRFGCRLAGDAEIRKFMEERRTLFDILMKELESCVEMGISILLPSPEKAADPEITGEGAGRVYLKSRQVHFDRLEQWQRECELLAEEFRLHLSGHYVKAAGEGPFSHRHLASLYFLVPRGSVEKFRVRARVFPGLGRARLLLSGPWPPYNFVTEAHLPSALPEKRQGHLRISPKV
jgi:hypothetical protein